MSPMQVSALQGRDEEYVFPVDYRVLGPLEVLVDGVPLPLGGPKQRVVVAVLVAAAGRPVPVDVLLEAVYGEEGALGSRRTLQTYVSNLRQVLGDVIVRQGDAYVLTFADSHVDSVEFEESYRAATAMTDADGAASRLRAALAMWRGHPYADVEAHGALDAETTRLDEVRLAALEARIEADLSAGRHREVVAELEALTVEHPWRENLRAMHMLALYRSGRQTEALRAFGRTRVSLAEGVGIDPSPELKDLERRILDHDRSLLVSSAPSVQRRAVVVADLDDAAGWSDPWERETAFAHRELELAAAADREGGRKLAPKGSAGYAVFTEPIQAVRAARDLVDDRTRVAVDFGDLEVHEDEPVGPPLARAARLVAVAHPGQTLLSAEAHEALTTAGLSGWAAESLGRFDIVGLDTGVLVYQLVGQGFASGFPELVVDRLPPSVPGVTAGSVPGYELRGLIGTGELGEVHRAVPARGRPRSGGADLRTMGGGPSAVRAPVRERVAAHRPRRPPARPSPARLLAGAEPGGHGLPARPRWHASIAHPRRRHGPGDGTGGDREGRRRNLRRPSAGCRARAGPTGEHPVRRRRQPVCRRPWDRRDLHRHRLVRDPRLRRPGAAGWRAGHAGCGHLLTWLCWSTRSSAVRRHPPMVPCRCGEMPSTPSSPGRPIPTHAAAMARSTSSSTSCARHWPSRSRHRQCSCRRATRIGAWRRSRRSTPAISMGAHRWSRTWSTSSGGTGCWSSSDPRASASRRWSRPVSSLHCGAGRSMVRSPGSSPR